MTPGTQTLTLLDGSLAICRLDPGEAIPAWVTASSYFSISRTLDELSIVCPEAQVPDKIWAERGWRALKLEGPFDRSLTGVLVSVLAPLAEAEVGSFALSTYDTDYVLVRNEKVENAAAILSRYGHDVRLTDDKLTSVK